MSIDMDANLLNMKVSDDLTIGLYCQTDSKSAIDEIPACQWTLYYYDADGEELGYECMEFGEGSAHWQTARVAHMYRNGELDIPGKREAAAAEMGFNFLDQHLPYGWRDRDWDDLDIDECDKCVLGILFMDYDYGGRILQELHGLNEFDHRQYGFTSDGMDPDKLNKEWLKLLQQ